MKTPDIKGFLKQQRFMVLALVVLAATAADSPAQTQLCVETNGIKYVQWPDLYSGHGADVWDCNVQPQGVTDGPWFLADDFVCTNAGPITDIHLWGSWQNNTPLPGSIKFQLYILDNVPASPLAGFSHPGTNVLWHQTFAPGFYAENVYTNNAVEYFLDPGPPQILGGDSVVWYYCFYPTNLNQYGTVASPTTNWLVVFAELPSGTSQVFGWKTTTNIQNDVSVHGPWLGSGVPPIGIPWTPTYDSGSGQLPLDLAFKINTATNNAPPPVICADTNTPKFYLPPQPNQGLDVKDSRNGIVLADDFACKQTGPITGIHIWGSWLADQPGTITNFWLGFYSDVPAVTSPASGLIISNSHPGALLWSNNFSATQFTFGIYTNGDEYFYNPTNNTIMGGDTVVWYYCFYPTNPFVQLGTATAPTNYWLAIRAQVADSNTNIIFGWKSSIIPYQDPAVWGTFAGGLPDGNWQSMTNPLTQQQLDLSMLLTTSNTPTPPPCVDGNGVKYDQEPNLSGGYDIWNSFPIPTQATDGPWVVADDFVCNQSGQITDLHLWGSWLNNQVLTNKITFTLGLYDNVATNANNPYSHPGNLLWSQTFVPGRYGETFYGTGTETFIDPGPPSSLGPENYVYYYCFNPTNLYQQQGHTYWLAAVAQLPAGTGGAFGWKTTYVVTNDISVHTPWPGTLPPSGSAWAPTFSPQGVPLDLSFRITTPTNRCPVPVACQADKTVNCGSTWSFDPPLVGPDSCCSSNPVVTFSTVTNISGPCQEIITGTWDISDCQGFIGYCTQNVTVVDTNPPVFSGCVASKTVQCGSSWVFDTPTASYVCSGSNVYVGVLATTVTNVSACTQIQTRVWSATNVCSFAVAYCTESVTVQDTNAPVFSGCVTAKTLPCGSVVTFDTPTATYLCSGSNAPVGVFSLTNYTVNACTTVQQKTWAATNLCSLAVGTCTETVTIVATNPPVINCQPDKFVTNGTAWTFDKPTAMDPCSGVTNITITVISTITNGSTPCNETITRTWLATDACSNSATCSQTVTNVCVPVVCVESDNEKYVQGPKVIGGYDVWNNPYVLADDFVCTNIGPVSDIHLWASWNSNLAQTNSIIFWLGIYNNVPTNNVNKFSHPGTNLLWQQWFTPGQYAEAIWTANASENFLDPGTTNCIGSDSVAWYYCFYPTNAFEQAGTPTNPVTYWLAAYATNVNNYGWKTTTNVSHDVSVHAFWPGYAPTNINPGWQPTFAYTNCTPPYTNGLDLAFKVTMCGPLLNAKFLPPTNVVVTWEGGGYLQSATNNILGPYYDVPGSPTSPFIDYSVSPTNKFYRLRCY